MREYWNREELIQMLLDRELVSELLILKGGDTKVQRFANNDKPYIKKMHSGHFAASQIREVEFLLYLNSIEKIKKNIVLIDEYKKSQSKKENYFYTAWGGFDLLQWQSILGMTNPLLNSVDGILALVWAILDAIYEFHSYGLVHNDFHFGNIIMDYSYDTGKNVGLLFLDKIKFIDFEFSLKPVAGKDGFPGRGQPVWQDSINSKSPIYLNPEYHSDLVCAAETESFLDNDKCIKRRYKKDGSGNFILKENPFQHLPAVDFGVDFFTLAQSLEELISLSTPHWRDEHIREFDSAHDFLLALPDKLREYEDYALREENGPLPHLKIMREISNLVDIPNYIRSANFFISERANISASLQQNKTSLVVQKRTKKMMVFNGLKYSIAPLVFIFGIYAFSNLLIWKGGNGDSFIASQYSNDHWTERVSNIKNRLAKKDYNNPSFKEFTTELKDEYSKITQYVRKSHWWVTGKISDNVAENQLISRWIHLSEILHSYSDLPAISKVAKLNFYTFHIAGKNDPMNQISPTPEMQKKFANLLVLELNELENFSIDIPAEIIKDVAEKLITLVEVKGGEEIDLAPLLSALHHISDTPYPDLQFKMARLYACFLPQKDYGMAKNQAKKAKAGASTTKNGNLHDRASLLLDQIDKNVLNCEVKI